MKVVIRYIVLAMYFLLTNLYPSFAEGSKEPKNLVLNSSFESFEGTENDEGVDTFGHWATVSVSDRVIKVYAIGNSDSKDGKRYMKVVGQAGFGARVEQIVNLDIPIGNKTYTFSVWAKADTAMEGPQIYLTDGISQGAEPKMMTLSTEWQRFNATKAFTNSASKQICLYFGPSANAVQTFYIDAVQVEEGDAPTTYIPPLSAVERIALPRLKFYVKQDSKRKGLTGVNIYLPGEIVTFSAEVANPKEQEMDAAVEYEIKDFFGEVAGKKLEVFKVPSQSHVRKEFTYQPLKNGVYYMTSLLKDKEDVIKGNRLSFSVIPQEGEHKIRPEDSPFGIVVGPPTDMLPVAGIKWVRHNSYWHLIESEKEKFDWSREDSIISDAQKYGFEVMPIISYSSVWASTGPKDDPKAIFYPPDLKEWERHVTNFVSRYKGKVKYWEVWNEPDSEPAVFIGGSPEEYAELLKTSYIAAKKIDPECKIVGCVTGGYNWTYIDKVFKAGGFAYLDVVSTHPYRSGWKSPEESDFLGELKKVKEVIDKYGGGKPVWLTEFDYPADDVDIKSDEFIKRGLIITEKEQADYLVRMYVQALSTGYAEKLFWFTLRHPIGSLTESPDSAAGLIRQDNTLKPSFLAHRTLVDKLEGAAFVSKYISGSSVNVYNFKRDDAKITVIWDSEGESIGMVDTGGKEVHLTDIMHNTQKLPVSKKIFPLKLGESPVFIEGDVKILGNVFDIKGIQDKIISFKKPINVTLLFNNIMDYTIPIELKVESTDLKAEPDSKSFELGSKGTTSANFQIAVKNPGIPGKRKIKFVVSLPDKLKAEKELEFFVVAPDAVLVDNFENDIKSWTTNIDEKHVNYNIIEKSTDIAQEGKSSLHWKCKSNLWNNLSIDTSGIDTEGIKQIEFWVYLPKLPEGNNTLSIEMLDQNNNRFGYWGKLFLNEAGKWKSFLIDVNDLDTHVTTPKDTKINLRKIRMLVFNYTGGELEVYIDNLQFRK